MMRTSRLNARVLLTCGAIGPPLCVVVFLIEGATRPDYRPLRHPVSSLSLGAAGWVQSANFLITGVLVLAFALGLRPALRRYGGGIWAPLLIGLVGVGLVGAGLFPADPMSGYPAGTPMVPVRTTRGVLHDAFSTPVFTALPAACFVIAGRFAKVGRRGWAGYSVATAVVFLICFVLAGIGFSQHPTFMPIGGLLQRVTLIVGLAWLTALALHLLRQGGQRPPRARTPVGTTRCRRGFLARPCVGPGNIAGYQFGRRLLLTIDAGHVPGYGSETLERAPDLGLCCGRYWDRTSDLIGVNWRAIRILAAGCELRRPAGAGDGALELPRLLDGVPSGSVGVACLLGLASPRDRRTRRAPVRRVRRPLRAATSMYLRVRCTSLLGMRTNRVRAPWVVKDTSFIPGSACWIDVSTADPAGSRDFYAGLFGWTYQIDPDPDCGHYTTARCGGRPVAGLAGVPMQAGQPATWTLYLASTNITHTAEVFAQWGGRMLYGPADVPGQGRVLIGADPTGAVIGFWQPTTRWTFHTTNPGALFWAELNTWDGARADEFFANMFDYRQLQIGDGRYVDYTTWSHGRQMMLGRLQMNEDWAPPGIAAHWMLHFAVDPQTGTDAAVNRVLDLGGRVDIDPYDTELGRIARVVDPSGGAFALIDPTERLPTATDLAAGSARVDDPYDD